MAKRRLNESIRSQLLGWMIGSFDEKQKPQVEKLKKTMAAALEIANKAIRRKYPESDMVIMRKYGYKFHDKCIKFVNEETQQVFGADFDPWDPSIETGFNAEEMIVDMPIRRGCHSIDVYPVTAKQQEIIEKFLKLREQLEEDRNKKRAEYSSFIQSCRTVEDVNDVIKLPQEMLQSFVEGRALVLINPEIINSIKKDFSNA